VVVKRRPWLGECFLWFVSFAPKEMNETLFASFSKKKVKSLILIHPLILFYISSIDSPLYEMSYFLNSCVACSITSARCFSTPMLISSA